MGLLIGASMNETDLPNFKGMLVGNNIMRIFPKDTTVATGKVLKVIPPWTDARFKYCQDNGVIPFVSTKVDGDSDGLAYVKNQLINMPSWITTLYITDRHEPEGDSGSNAAATYKTNFKAFYEMLATLNPTLRAKIKCGPVLTKTWTEKSSGGNNDYSIYDPMSIGVGGDFFAVDMYVETGTTSAVVSPSTMPTPEAFVNVFKNYKYNASDTRPRMWPEWGLIGMPADTTGTARGNWITAVHNIVKTWKVGQPGWTQPWSFIGWIWWHSVGKATGQVKDVGQARDFPLHLRSVPDPDKTTTGSDGKTQWFSHPETLPGTPPPPVAAFNAAYTEQNTTVAQPISASFGTAGGFAVAGKMTVTGGNPPATPTTGWILGATMKKEDIASWEPRLASNKIFRIFPNSNGLPPAWDDPRFAYAQRVGAIPFVSSNIDGDTTKFAALRQWIIDMPAWVKTLYITDRHEPENNFPDATVYKNNFTAWWNQVIATLPATTRPKVRAGHLLSRQWAEKDATRSYLTYDTGLGDFFGTDHYFNSWGSPSTTVATSYGTAADFVAKFAAYKFNPSDARDRIWGEWGAIGIPADPTGEQRAKWMKDVAAILDTWGPSTTGWKFIGAIWWNNQGTTSPTSLTGSPGIGTLRYFYLDSYQNAVDQPPVPYAATPAPPLAAYNQLALTHQTVGDGTTVPPDPVDPTPPPDPVDPTPNPDPEPGGGNNDPGDASNLPADLPPSARLMSAEYVLLITDRNLNVLGDPISTWTTLDLTLRFNEPGSGIFTAPGYSWTRDQLVPGARVVCIRRVLGSAKVVLAGPIEETNYERSDDGENGGAGKLTVSWVEDSMWLGGRLTYPEPTKTPETQAKDFWTFSGKAELGMLSLVNLNAGPGALAVRQVPRLIVAAAKGVGGNVTVSATLGQARFIPVSDCLRDMAKRGGGLGFRTYQTMTAKQIVFEVFKPRDLSKLVRFGFNLGNLKYLSYVTEIPEVTAVIVGGQYNKDDVAAGADKFVTEVRVTRTEAEWGRVERYLPRPGNDPVADLKEEADRELAGDNTTPQEVNVPTPVSTSRARLASTAADTPDQRYGVHYDIGDVVSIEIWSGQALTGAINTVHIQAWPTAGEVVNTNIGDQAETQNYARVKQLRSIDRRVAYLERNATVQKSTTT